MDVYLAVKTLHILSATILFGTGIGIAFFMFRSSCTDNYQQKLFASRTTVIADYFFTFPSAIIQPVTGFWLIHLGGFNWSDKWLLITYIIYALVGICWLPVVWIQIQLKKILLDSISHGIELPSRYHQLFRIWFYLGWPAFIGLIVVFFLMVMKPI